MKTIDSKINYINAVLNEDYEGTCLVSQTFKDKKLLIIERAEVFDCSFENIDCLILKYCDIIRCKLGDGKIISYYSLFIGDGDYNNVVIAEEEKEIDQHAKEYFVDFKPNRLYPPDHPNQNPYFTLIEVD